MLLMAVLILRVSLRLLLLQILCAAGSNATSPGE
jgi:hypothetical protein